MEKGINLILKEVKDNLAKVVNEANLPIAIIAMVLRELTAEASAANEQMVAKEKNDYENGMKKELEESSKTVK